MIRVVLPVAWTSCDSGEADARRVDGVCVVEVEDEDGGASRWVATRGGFAGTALDAQDLAGAVLEADRRWPLREG